MLIAACSRKTEKTSEEETYGVSTTDSLEILSNTDIIMQSLHNENFDEAVNKLYVFNQVDTTVSPISEETATQIRNRSRIFPVKDFKVKEADFRDPLYNIVVYDVMFGDPDPETGEAPKTKMAFNIVKIENNYYVTIMDQPTLR